MKSENFSLTFSHLVLLVFNTKVLFLANANSSLYSTGRKSNIPFSCAAILDCTKNRTQEKKVQHFLFIHQFFFKVLKSFFLCMVE